MRAQSATGALYSEATGKETPAIGAHYAFTGEERGIIRQVVFLIFMIISVLLVSSYSDFAAAVFGMMIVLYLTLLSFRNPKKALFAIFGTKLTYDALWNVGKALWGNSNVNFLSIILVPLLIIMVLSPKLKRDVGKTPLWGAVILLAWVVMATLLNGLPLSLDYIVRQSGIVFGLLIGFAYLRDERDFNLMVLMLFISTLVPVMVTLFQYLAVAAGKNFFYYSVDSVRGLRQAGLYYDAGTNGMTMLVSLFTGAYLFRERLATAWKRYGLVFIFLTAYFAIFLSATRSVLVIATVAIAFLLLTDFKRWHVLLPLIAIVLVLGKPQIEKAVDRTMREGLSRVEWSQVLTEKQYQGLFTGRVYIWQNIWYRYERGSLTHRLLGSGVRTNAHSSYFFLLLQVGLLGMMLYVFINLNILLTMVFRRRENRKFFLIGILFVIGISLLGFSLNTVIYTSFQWSTYLIIGGVLNIITTGRQTALPENQ